jgi:hypothetical protein
MVVESLMGSHAEFFLERAQEMEARKMRSPRHGVEVERTIELGVDQVAGMLQTVGRHAAIIP